MYSNMCLKIVLCLALIACIDGYIIKHQRVPLSPKGTTVEIAVKHKGDEQSVSIMTIDIDERDSSLVMSAAEAPAGVPQHPRAPAEHVPTLENRNGIRVGNCPVGYTGRAGFCFPDNDS